MLPTLDEVKTHLDIDLTDVAYDSELQDFLDTAVELAANEIGEDVADIDVTSRPALKTAIIELVRDMWINTQTNGATLGGGLDDDDEAAASGLDRPAIPPYVLSLLAPYLPQPVSTASFPDAPDWPCS